LCSWQKVGKIVIICLNYGQDNSGLFDAKRVYFICTQVLKTLPGQCSHFVVYLLVLCEYSKFRIDSNSYLLFNSIRNWRNYSKFSNTYSTVISRATETRFVCTLPATGHCTRLSLKPVLRCVCVPTTRRAPTPPTPLTTTQELPQAPASTVTSDRVITAGGKHSARSVERWTFCQYCYGFNFNTETCCI